MIERLLLARARTDIKDRLQGNTALHVLALANHTRAVGPASTITGQSETIRQTMTSQQLSQQ